MEVITEDMTIYVTPEGGEVIELVAVVTWVLPNGVAWVDPGYIDPHGASRPMFHRENGRVSRRHGKITVKGKYYKVEAFPLSQPDRYAVDALARYALELRRQGTSRTDEARRLQAALAEALA